MHDNLRKRYYVSAADTPNIDGAAAVSEFAFPMPVIVTRVGVTATTTVDTDNSVALTATLSRRPLRGSASNAVTLGTFRMAPAGNTTQLVAGNTVYKDLAIVDHDGETAEDGSQRNVAPNRAIASPIAPPTLFDGSLSKLDQFNAFLILPGQSFAMTLDASAEADSGAVVSFVEVIELPLDAEIYDPAGTVIADVSDL